MQMTNPGEEGLPLNMKPWGTRTCITKASAARAVNPSRAATKLRQALIMTAMYQVRCACQHQPCAMSALRASSVSASDPKGMLARCAT